MVDLRSVIEQVKRGKYPSNWRVYCVPEKNIAARICWVFAGCTGVIGLLSCSASEMSRFFCVILLMVVFAGIAIVFTRTIKPSSSILVILPVSVVVNYTINPQKIYWLSFPTIYKMKIAQETEIRGFDGDVATGFHYWLDVYLKDGAYRKWQIDECFGDTAAICKDIIAAYNYHCRH